MGKETGKLENRTLSRRDFVAASIAAAALLNVAGCSPDNTLAEAGAGDAAPQGSNPETDGEWVPAACWHNCGGRCINYALVADGAVLRQKTDDTHEDSLDYPQQRGCVRGRSQRRQCLGSDRLKYPMKRKGWQPGGGENAHGDLRGVDEWERISWDEAISYIVDEIKRVSETYGNRSIFCSNDGHFPGGSVSKVLALYGGFVPRWGTGSWGSWSYASTCLGVSAGDINDRYDFYNCEYVVMVGENPTWSSAGNPSYLAKSFKDAGVKFIGIDPFYNDSYAAFEAEWIPCRPSTDAALFIGLAYTMLELDAEEQLIDWDFLNSCTIGFDADHMPEGEDPKGNYKDYLLGTYDGIPKNAAWASEITGVSEENFYKVARILGKDTKVALLTGWASARTQNSENVPQSFMALGAMGGHFGKSGHMTAANCSSSAFNGGPALISVGSDGLPEIKNPVAETDIICHAELWRAIVTGTYTMAGDGANKVPGVVKDIDIKIIYHDSGAYMQTADDQNLGIQAHRKVDLVVSHAMFLTSNAMYSDIVLPITSKWEAEGGLLTGNREMVVYYSKVIDPLYECKSDQQIAELICEGLGLDSKKVYPFDEKQQLMNQLLDTTVMDGGRMRPLVTITQSDLDEWGCEGEPQEGVIDLAEFKKKGIYQVPRSKGDQYSFIFYEDFVKDPEANPRDTESGKLEICCRAYRDNVNAIGYSTIEAIPTYIASAEGIEATYSDWASKTKGEFPFQAFNLHYLRRSHTVFDNVLQLREAFPNPVFINAADAAEKGISTGDSVLVSSPRGKSLRYASVTERMIPGAVGLPHGAWVNVDPSTGIDTAGSDNFLTGSFPTGQGTSGWNTCLCNIEKYDGEPLAFDVDVPQRIPAAQQA